MTTRKQHPKLHDPLTLLFAPALLAGGILLVAIGDSPLRAIGLLFAASGGLWLVDAWRGDATPRGPRR